MAHNCVCTFLVLHSLHIFLFVFANLLSSSYCNPNHPHENHTNSNASNWNGYNYFSGDPEMQSCVATAELGPHRKTFAHKKSSQFDRTFFFKNFSDYKDNYNYNPFAFANITKYELLRAFICRKVNFIQNVKISRSAKKFEQVRNKCYTRTQYKYVKCSYPFGKEYTFRKWKGYGLCHRREWSHKNGNVTRLRQKNKKLYGLLYSRKRIVTFCRQLNRITSEEKIHPAKYSKNQRKWGNDYNRNGNETEKHIKTNTRYQKYGKYYGYGKKYYGKGKRHGYGRTYGHFLQSIVSQFVLIGKKEKYDKFG